MILKYKKTHIYIQIFVTKGSIPILGMHKQMPGISQTLGHRIPFCTLQKRFYTRSFLQPYSDSEQVTILCVFYDMLRRLAGKYIYELLLSRHPRRKTFMDSMCVRRLCRNLWFFFVRGLCLMNFRSRSKPEWSPSLTRPVIFLF